MSNLDALKGQLADMGNDLFNLEVSTILKPNISATKMTDARNGLIDIAKTYYLELMEEGLEMKVDDQCRLGSMKSFQQMAELAGKRIKALGAEARANDLSDDEKSSLILMERIQTKCGQLNRLLEAVGKRGIDQWENNLERKDIVNAPSLDLKPKELVLLRKTWELGVEEVAMQTVVQLDGDVVTRIQPKYAHMDWEALHSVHNQGLKVSMSMWQELVNILKYFLDKGLSLLMPGVK